MDQSCFGEWRCCKWVFQFIPYFLQLPKAFILQSSVVKCLKIVMTRLQPMVTQWQGWMQLQRLLSSTNTHVIGVPELILAANTTAYAAEGEPSASETFCPETSALCCPPWLKAVPPLQSALVTWDLKADLQCLGLPPAVRGRAGSNPALNISNPVRMGFLWRHRRHHQICHCNLIVKFFYADCDHVMTNLLFFLPQVPHKALLLPFLCPMYIM